MKKVLLMMIMIIFMLSCRSKNNYNEYTGYWEIKKSSGIEILEIKKTGKDYTYKVYEVKKAVTALMRDWEETKEGVKITEKGSGTLTPKKGVLLPDYDKELSVIDEMMRFCIKDGKLYYLDGYDAGKNSSELKTAGYVKLDEERAGKFEKIINN